MKKKTISKLLIPVLLLGFATACTSKQANSDKITPVTHREALQKIANQKLNTSKTDDVNPEENQAEPNSKRNARAAKKSTRSAQEVINGKPYAVYEWTTTDPETGEETKIKSYYWHNADFSKSHYIQKKFDTNDTLLSLFDQTQEKIDVKHNFVFERDSSVV